MRKENRINMANANPTMTSKVLASKRRNRRPTDDIGAIPSLVLDDDLISITQVIAHGTLGTARSMSLSEAVKDGYISIIPYGDKHCVFIKSHSVQVILNPSTNLIKMATSCCGGREGCGTSKQH